MSLVARFALLVLTRPRPGLPSRVVFFLEIVDFPNQQPFTVSIEEPSTPKDVITEQPVTEPKPREKEEGSQEDCGTNCIGNQKLNL